MAFETKMRPVGGLQTELTTIGAGPPLLYLHAGDGVEGARPLLERLAGAFTVYAPSHPGFGASELPATLSSVDDLAYFYLDLLEELDLRDVVLAGSSFGGWIAAEIAVRNTSRLARLVLAAPVGAKFSDRESSGIADLFSMTDQELAACLYHEVRSVPDYSAMSEDEVTRIVRNRESLTLFGWSPCLFNSKLRQRLHRIDVRTLLLWGDSDRVLASGYAKDFASAVRGAQSSTVARAGHYLHADQPGEVASAIQKFVAPPLGRA